MRYSMEIQIVFLCLEWTTQSENKKTVQFSLAPEGIKYLRINLVKSEKKNVYSEIYKFHWTEVTKLSVVI